MYISFDKEINIKLKKREINIILNSLKNSIDKYKEMSEKAKTFVIEEIATKEKMKIEKFYNKMLNYLECGGEYNV